MKPLLSAVVIQLQLKDVPIIFRSPYSTKIRKFLPKNFDRILSSGTKWLTLRNTG